MKWKFDDLPMRSRIVIVISGINFLSLLAAFLAYFVFVGMQSFHGVKPTIWIVLLITLLIALFSFILTYLLASRLQRSISGPLINLAQTVKTVTTQVQEESEILEEEVAKRTLELARRNRELKKEIKERAAVEVKLKKLAEDLGRSNQELEQFAYVASHDLQEPLRTVASYTGLIKKRYAAHLDQNALEFIDLAQDGVDRMQKLIKGLLEYSRVGRKEENKETLDLNQVLVEVKQNLNSILRESNARLLVDELPKVEGIHSQLVQLFQNLISNALKFKSEQTPEIKVFVQNENGERVFCVQDNGIGIDSEFKERIFVIFQRLHTHDQYPGTGIGLSLVKKIVERHGGRIWVEANPGGGSIFKFTIS